MNPDITMVVGILLAGYSVPAFLSALSDRLPVRLPIILGIVGAGLTVHGVRHQAPGFAITDIPDVFFRVIGLIVQ